MLRTMQIYKMLDQERRQIFKGQFWDAFEIAKEMETPIKIYVECVLDDDLGLEFEDDKQLHDFIDELKHPEKVQRAMRVVEMLEG